MALSVIGVGASRTGTLSLKLALEQLGFGPCYHMAEVWNDARKRDLWTRIFDGAEVDWDDVFQGYGAAVDAPALVVYEKLVAHYPNAKCVLTVRDPERVADSLMNTIYRPDQLKAVLASAIGPMMQSLVRYQLAQQGIKLPPNVDPNSLVPSRDQLIARYKAHVDDVKRRIAPERLLVFEVAQGWGPLCKFLGKSVPSTPFPRVNDSEEFHNRFPAPAA